MFEVTIKQVCIMFLYISIGYLIRRVKLVDKSVSKDLSKLLTYVCLPAYVLNVMAEKVTVANLNLYMWQIIVGIAFTVIALTVSHFLGKVFGKTKLERNCYKYMFAFGNCGYFGYPLIEAVFGTDMLVQFIFFCLPATTVLNSYGYILLTNLKEDGTQKKVGLNQIFSPAIIGMILGVTLGLLPITIPQVLFEIVAPAGACMSPIAMLIAGIVLASFSLKELLSSVKGYVFSVVKMIGFPLVFGAIAYVLYLTVGLTGEIFIMVVAFACLPAGMNSVVFPESAGLDSSVAARPLFCSYIFALITVPLMFMIAEALVIIA